MSSKTQDYAQKTYLALDEDSRIRNVKNLQTVLANTIYFYHLYKKYHWHVSGKDFYEYHKLFDRHSEEQLPLIDLVAERIRTLGGNVAAMPTDVVADATLVETKEAHHEAEVMVDNLLVAHEEYLRVLRKAIAESTVGDDEGTSDLLVSEVLRVHELELWFLRSSVARKTEINV